jgi:MFS family permease
VRSTHGSFAAAGAASAAYLAAAAAARPLHGRWVDRAGTRVPLLAGSAMNALSLVLVAVAAWRGAPAWVLVALSALAGVTLPALSAAMRALWPRLAPDAGEHAYALDTLSYELSLIAAPALVGGLAVAASAPLALIAISALGFAGTAVVATAPVAAALDREPGEDGRAPRGLTAAVRPLIAMSFCIGAAEGSMTVLAPGVAAAHHDHALSGLLLSALSAGSLVGALAYGSVSHVGTLPRRLIAGTGGLTVACLLLAGFGTTLAGFAVTAALVGLVLSPTLTAGFVAVRHAAAAGALTEAFTWASLAAASGAAICQALAGVLVAGDGARTALWLAPVAAGAGLVAAIRGRTRI